MNPALRHQLTRLTRALRAYHARQGLSWGLVTALTLLLLAAAAARLAPLWDRPTLLAALGRAVLGGTLGGMLIGWCWPAPPLQRWRWLDRRLGLADRLTTAWELSVSRISAPPAFVHAQTAETLRTLAALSLRQHFPLRAHRLPLRLALWLSGSLALLLWLPNPQLTELQRRELQRQIAQEQAVRLETLTVQLAADPALTAAQRAAALAALQAATAALRNPQATPAEQQAALTAAERQLSALRSAETAARVQALAEAAPFAPAAVAQPLTAALQRGDVAAAAEYLRSLTDPTGRPLTPEELTALADTLARLADSLQTTDPALAQAFQQTAQEIYNGDLDTARAALQQAAETLDATAEAAAANRQLEQAQAQLQAARQATGGSSQNASAPAGSPASSTAAEPGHGAAGHHEDTGTGAPFGAEEAARLEGSGGELTVPRPPTQIGAGQLQTGQSGPARVPYRQVYTAYRQAAEATLSQRSYPPALRTTIQQYFSALEP